MPERLLAETRALHESVDALVSTLDREYPKRAEIKKARTNFAIAIIIGLLLSGFISSVVTIGTVSGCFLSKSAVDGHAPHICSVMPGYDATQDRARRSTDKFTELFQTTDTNEQRIDRLEMDLEKLKSR